MKRLIDRDTYKKIRKFDRHEMEDFLSKVYMQGATDQPMSDPVETLDKIRLFLHQSLGIGEIRWKRIEKDIWNILTK